MYIYIYIYVYTHSFFYKRPRLLLVVQALRGRGDLLLPLDHVLVSWVFI